MEAFVCPSAEQACPHIGERFAGFKLLHRILRCCPVTISETVAHVFLAARRRLHHAVKSQIGNVVDLSHFKNHTATGLAVVAGQRVRPIKHSLWSENQVHDAQ